MKVEVAQLRRIVLGEEASKKKDKNLFHALYTEEGLENLTAFFTKRAGDEKGWLQERGRVRFVGIKIKEGKLTLLQQLYMRTSSQRSCPKC